jgi:hypothetical protein
MVRSLILKEILIPGDAEVVGPSLAEGEIERFERDNFVLPEDYKSFLKIKNGFYSDSSGIYLYSLEDVVPQSVNHEIMPLCKNMVAIGYDSGEYFYLIDYTKESCVVFAVEGGEIGFDEYREVGGFLSWADQGFSPFVD